MWKPKPKLTYESLLRAGRDHLVRWICAVLPVGGGVICGLAFDGAAASLVGV